MNNKGFTLVEVLAVLVILVTIVGISFTSISAFLERNKVKQNEQIENLIKHYASLYVSDHREAIRTNFNGEKVTCFIYLSTLKENNYLTDEEITDADGNILRGVVLFNMDDNSYVYENEMSDDYMECVVDEDE